MKNRILSNSFRTIKKLFPRFLSLLLISFLGAFTYLGLTSTYPNMINSLDTYLDDSNTYDIKILSTLGLVDEDIEALKKIDNVKDVEGSYSKDVLVPVNDQEYVINISSITSNVNKIELLSGSMPKNMNEIVIEPMFLELNNLKIGDELIFFDSDLMLNNLTIVGTIDSSLYFNASSFSQNRGTTNIGGGTIHYYSFGLPSLFNLDYYTSVYITLENTLEETTSSELYEEKVANTINEINKIKEIQEQNRYNNIVNEFNSLKEQIELYLSNYENEINQKEKEYNNILISLNIQESEIDTKINIIENRINELNDLLSNLSMDDPLYNDYQNELQTLNIELDQYKTLKETKEKIEQEKIKLSTYKNLAEQKIQEAEETLKKVSPKWIVMDRTYYVTYTEYIDDTSSINNLAKIFPIIFFTVSILISLVSMNRMVEEDRQEIGTLKSMGFTNKHIMTKYILFSLFATSIGAVSGSFLGVLIIPNVIFNIYSLLFSIPKMYNTINIVYFVICLLITIGCVLGTTYFTVIKVVREKPSQLMRPKAPKNGKRVFLEKIKWLWNKLSFSNKVTVRNVFRYKKRAIVTIIGIAGCCALMMTGFGLKDSIVDIPDRQFGDIFTFDAMVYVNDYKESDEYIFEDEDIKSSIRLQNINATTYGKKTSIFVIEDNEDISKFINIYDSKTKKLQTLKQNEVAISDKLAQLENISIGATVEFYDSNNFTYEYKVAAIAENYIEHYIFMMESTYELSGQTFTPNTVCIQTNDLNEEQKEDLSKRLLTNDKVISISYVDELVSKVNNMFDSLNKVILILIILASTLSFVVLYNLSNINIQERKKEVASLKVLGFYHKEVDNYLIKENTILTIIGIIVGFVLGYFLTLYVIKTVEIEKAVFMTNIKFTTYLYSLLLTVIFTYIVNKITHFVLKKINMIESLKSVE